MKTELREQLAKQVRGNAPAVSPHDDEQTERANFNPPLVMRGWPVTWYDDRYRTNSYIGIVAENHNGLLDLLVMVPNEPMLTPKNGVRHISDPNKSAIDNANEGCWDHSPEMQRLLSALDAVYELKTDNGAIEILEGLRLDHDILSKRVAELEAASKPQPSSNP